MTLDSSKNENKNKNKIDCQSCCDTFSSDQIIECPSCHFIACKPCITHFITLRPSEDSNTGWKFPQCMSCKKEYDDTFIRNAFEKHYVEGSLKKYLNDYYENPNFDLIEYSQIIPINNYLEINRSIYRNENFNFKMINDLKILFPEFEIEYDLLGNKKNIDFDFILSNNYDWDIDYLSQNPNLTFDIIDKYNWNFSYMSFNTFDKQRELYVENH